MKKPTEWDRGFMFGMSLWLLSIILEWIGRN